MLGLYGIPLDEADARRLIATLIADGDEDALSAAAMIRMGLDDELYTVALTIEMREAILDVLEDPPSEPLAELRGVLVRDHEHRRRAS